MTAQNPSGPDAPAPPPTFDALPLSADLRRAVDACGYVYPTPVQLAVFEPAVRGKNLVVQARTGTGKTAAFGLPILDGLVKRSVDKVQALILSPTRELALQITRELERLGANRGLKIACIYGGAPMGKQIEQLESGAQIVAGTPGRVLDHLRRGTLDPSNIRVFVLDEADEMLSMGFAKELHAIADRLPKERQGLFFSATIPPDIERLAQAQLKDPEFITLSSDQIGALEINHFVYMLRGGDKRGELVRILEVEDPESAIVFCNTKSETEVLAEALKRAGYEADWLNGDLEQSARERVMQATREGKLRFLVATDVAARGIDISHLTHVINADFPESAEAYVHRTGRTGRAGKTGTAISLVGPKDIGNLYILRLTYKIRPVERELPTKGELKTRAETDLVDMFVDAFAARPLDVADASLARRLLSHPDAERIVASLLRDHLGAHAAMGEKDVASEAAAARRAKNPPPVAPPPPPKPAPREAHREREAPKDREPRAARPERPARTSDSAPPPTRAEGRREPPRDRAREPRRGGGVPHKNYATWEPPEEADDDKPLLASEAPPPLPGYREADAPREPRGERPERGERHDRGERQERDERDDPSLAQIFVNVGRRDGVRASDLQKLLVDGAGLAPEEAGRIRMRDRNTFVSVKKEDLEKAIAALAGQVLGGRNVVAEPAKPRAS